MRSNRFIPLTDIEQASFDKALGSTPFYHWLGHEVLCKPPTPLNEQRIGNVGFVFGALGSAYVYDLGFVFAKRLGLSDALATLMACMILFPRIILNGNIAQDTFKDVIRAHHTSTPQPFKNNQALLRQLSKSAAMVCVLSGAITNIYVNYRYLSLPTDAKYAFIPIACVSSILLNMKPFFQKIDATFARYNPGATEEVRQKRAALLYALGGALQVIRSYDADLFARFYEEMSQPLTDESQIQARWERLLALSQEALAAAPRTWQTRMRGASGWIIAFLAAISNMSLSYGVSKWIMDSEDLAPWFSVTAVITCTILWTGPTQRLFEGKLPKPNWKPTHARLRTASDLILPIFGFLSAFPHVLWPWAEGKNIYEQSLSIPALIGPGALYSLALVIRLGRMLDHYDRYVAHTPRVEHMDFLKRLEALPGAIATLPDEEINNLLPSREGVAHPVLAQYCTTIKKGNELKQGAGHESQNTGLANIRRFIPFCGGAF